MLGRESALMSRSRKNSTIFIAVVGTSIFVLVLAVGTILTGLLAKKDTEKAVEAVSLLYLDELAGRREQVVSTNLNKKIEDMNVALELMNAGDLSDEAHLTKPVQPEVLFETLKSLIRTDKTGTEEGSNI